MSPAFKNITTVLIIILVAALGYYLYLQTSETSSVSGENVHVKPQMIRDTQVFIERRQILERIELDTSIFKNPLFVSYRNFTNPIQSQFEGKDNPFSENSNYTGGTNF